MRLREEERKFTIPRKTGGGGGRGGTGSNVRAAIAAASLSLSLGKGLREPCWPYREAYFFGAPFGQALDADNWNCIPEIADPTTFFDLAGMQPNHEVAVCLSVFRNLPAGQSYHVWHYWIERFDSTTELMFTYEHEIPDPADYGYESWAWYYVYSYVGYVDVDEYGYVEICRNGGYSVYVETIPDIGTSSVNFSVAGIEVPEPPEVGGKFQLANPIAGATKWSVGLWADGESSGSALADLDEEIWFGNIGDRGYVSISLYDSSLSRIYYVKTVDMVSLEGQSLTYDCLTASLDGVPAGYVLTFVITPAPDAGYITKSPDLKVYPPGTAVTLEAFASEMYEFDHWEVNGFNYLNSVVTITVNKNLTITADFTGAVPPPPVPYEGEITKIQMGHEGVLDDVPVPAPTGIGVDGQLHVYVRNNMDTAQKLGIHWIVRDPDESIEQEYEDWTFFAVLPGEEHDHFVAGTFDLDKAGTYTVLVEMLMGEEGVEEVIVDSYDGPLCSTIPEEPTPPPEGKFPWGWVLVGAGVLASAFALAGKRRKKESEAIEKSR